MSTAPLNTIVRFGLLLIRDLEPLLDPELKVMLLVALVKVRVATEVLLLVKFMLAPAMLVVP